MPASRIYQKGKILQKKNLTKVGYNVRTQVGRHHSFIHSFIQFISQNTGYR